MIETPYLDGYLEDKKIIDSIKVGSLWAYECKTPFGDTLYLYEVLSIENGRVMLRDREDGLEFSTSVVQFKRQIKSKKLVPREFVK